MFCCKCVCALLACLVLLEARRCLISWDWSFIQFWAGTRVLRIKPGSSGRKASAIKSLSQLSSPLPLLPFLGISSSIWMLGPQKVELLGSIRYPWWFWGFKRPSHCQFSLPHGSCLKMEVLSYCSRAMPTWLPPPSMPWQSQTLALWICWVQNYILSCLGQVSQ